MHLKFPHHAKAQFNRALLSIPLNLAEGSAKPTIPDRRKFYRQALASLREVQCLLRLYQHHHALDCSNTLGAMLYRLCKAME